MIVCKGKAGLGNRMLALAGASLYARLTGHQLAVDWRHRSSKVNAFEAHFDYSGFAPVPSDGAGQQVVPEAWQGRLNLTVDELLLVLHPDDELADSRPSVIRETSCPYALKPGLDVIAVRWGWDAGLPELRGAMPLPSAGSDTEMLRSEFKRVFRFNAETAAAFATLRQAHIKPGMLAVHVRYTDRKTSLKRILKIVDRQLKGDHYQGIFLATDNKMVEEMFKARYANVTTLPKWMPDDGNPIHRSSGGPGFLEIERSSLQDQYLLSCCEGIVFDSRSTFGLCAALMSGIAPARMIDLREQSKVEQLIELAKKVVKQALRR